MPARSKKVLGRSVFAAAIVLILPAMVAAESSGRISEMQWEIGPAPCSFKYGGAESASLLAKWPRSEETLTAPGGAFHRIVYTDPGSALRVSVEVRTFADYDAVEWVMRFANRGGADTPIIENILPLLWQMAVQVPPPIQEDIGRLHEVGGGNLGVVLHYAHGSTADVNDYEPLEKSLEAGFGFEIKSNGGRSSNGTMPFFNLQNGDHGVIGAIGWSGNWSVRFKFQPAGRAVELSAGMQRTHLRLHPGEEIRTPRVLLLNWQGDRVQAHNLWRRLLLAYYSPHANGQPVIGPAFYHTGGNESISIKLDKVRLFHDKGIPFDIYSISPGWYGNEPPSTTTSAGTPWSKFRGSWWPNPRTYPQGIKPIGDLLRSYGMGLMLWFEPEEADPGSTLLTQHPDWFLKPLSGGASLLDFGNAEARKGITDVVSGVISSSGVTWYRQDFNTNPDGFWARADSLDRTGMTEIRYIEGLYAYWDELAARNPGLQMGNCASGGRRIDLESISRCFVLTRTDLIGHTGDPAGITLQTAGISPWVPLSAGWCDGNTVFDLRSCYSPALMVDAGANVINLKQDAFLKQGIDEFHEVRPYFYGDFYPVLPYSLDRGAWTGWQFHRPDLNAGIAMFFRKKDSPIKTILVGLRGLDPMGLYNVEVRSASFGRGAMQHSLGSELADNLVVTIPEQPGASLVLYARMSQK